ncbi:MAG: hypothetical protein K1X57_02520 [Gemmataceae bacterium]|nr:hypothetical protein [Gemmataceae bacterium]
MDAIAAPEPPVNWQGLLGYLNFSDGRPDPRFQQQLHAAYQLVAATPEPLPALRELMVAELAQLHASGAAAFRDVDQAAFAIEAAFRGVPEGYLSFHGDLLGHLPANSVITPFFLARVAETVLQQRKSSTADRVTPEFVAESITRLNDYVGYRPVPVLESRAAIDYYPHEKLRPIPLYLRGVGVASGQYQEVIIETLKILNATSQDLLDDAQFDRDAVEEIAFDPRAYDHNHPANRRPNYVFGEWDPHHVNTKGRFTRFVIRQTILDLLMRRIAEGRTLQFQYDPEQKALVAHFTVPFDDGDRTYDAAAVLAGTTLMASMLCGGTPTAHDSGITLSNLVPKIAKLRDSYYDRLLKSLDGDRAERLRKDAETTRQPFGGVRQALNQSLAVDRAAHLQDRHLAVLFAVLGFPDESRRRAAAVAAPGVRFVVESRVGLTEAAMACERGDTVAALPLLDATVGVVKRGIECGALVDPWNILGFQGLYPLFQSREDSVHDPRVDELLTVMGDLFEGYSTVMIEAAARGDDATRTRAHHSLEMLADWWDQFATFEVSDVRKVHGSASLESAEHVARALALWKRAGGSEQFAGPSGSVAFWRGHLEGFKTPVAFARVVSALLDRQDYPASMALIMTWLSQAPNVPLGEEEPAFADQARRWMNKVLAHAEQPARLVARFFELLEANADEYWFVPELMGGPRPVAEADEEDPYGAAYEGMTFRDSANDGTEGALAGGETTHFSLEDQSERLRERIRFLHTVADLLFEASRGGGIVGPSGVAWREHANLRARELEAFANLVNEIELPAPDTSSFESSVEYDRRREMKETLVEESLAAALAFRQAARILGSTKGKTAGGFPWEPAGAALELATRTAEPEKVRKKLGEFLRTFGDEPLLYVPIGAGGEPQQVLRARAAQSILLTLLERLPRLGLLRETFFLTQLARKMEQNAPPEGRRVTEFDRIFPVGLRGSIETLIDSVEAEETEPDGAHIQELLNALTGPYLNLWLKHSQSLRLSILETIQGSAEWLQIENFVRRYGEELFTAQTLNLANLRAILHRGIESWVEQLSEQSSGPERFLEDLGRSLDKEKAIRYLEVVLQAIAENYDEYRDYNTTTTQSDYGNNLFLLLDYLRLKSAYDRDNWRLKPLLLTHEVLCRRRRTADAARWQEVISVYTRAHSEQHIQELGRLETKHALKLRTIRERLEERFVASLAQDRLAALLIPLWESAKTGGEEAASRLSAFSTALKPFTSNPVGAGLETPDWIRRLEREMALTKAQRESPPTDKFPVPPLAALRRQLTGDWQERNELP